jgi:hypothetical protein
MGAAVKPVSGRLKDDRDKYRKFDNPMTAILCLWMMSRDRKTIPGFSRSEAVLASLHTAARYVEMALRESGVRRERVSQVIAHGAGIGDDICDLCRRHEGALNLPPTAGNAGKILEAMVDISLEMGGLDGRGD